MNKIEAVGTTLEGRQIARNAVARRLVAVELDVHLVAKELASQLHRIVDGRRGRRTRGILERHAVKRNARIKNLFQAIAVKLRRVSSLIVNAGRESHHRHDDLVLQPRIMNALTRPLEVVHIVERVEVPNRGHAMLLEHLGMKLNHVGRLRLKTDHVDTTRKRLEIRLRCRLAEGIHHVKRILLAVEVAALETSTATRLKPANARIVGLRDTGEEILGENARTDNTLEAVAKRREHVLNRLLGHFVFSFSLNLKP